MDQRPVYRLTLDCGHTAFALEGEEHTRHRRRPCMSCGEGVWSRITHSRVQANVVIPEHTRQRHTRIDDIDEAEVSVA